MGRKDKYQLEEKKVRGGSSKADDAPKLRGCHISSVVCSIPRPCGDDEDGMMMECSNSVCPYKGRPVHMACFELFEDHLVKMLSNMGSARGWTDAQRRANLWERKGQSLIAKSCRCPCGKGLQIRDEQAFHDKLKKKQEDEIAATGGAKKKKKATKEALPKLNAGPIKGVVAIAQQERGRDKGVSGKKKGPRDFSSESDVTFSYDYGRRESLTYGDAWGTSSSSRQQAPNAHSAITSPAKRAEPVKPSPPVHVPKPVLVPAPLPPSQTFSYAAAMKRVSTPPLVQAKPAVASKKTKAREVFDDDDDWDADIDEYCDQFSGHASRTHTLSPSLPVSALSIPGPTAAQLAERAAVEKARVAAAKREAEEKQAALRLAEQKRKEEERRERDRERKEQQRLELERRERAEKERREKEKAEKERREKEKAEREKRERERAERERKEREARDAEEKRKADERKRKKALADAAAKAHAHAKRTIESPLNIHTDTAMDSGLDVKCGSTTSSDFSGGMTPVEVSPPASLPPHSPYRDDVFHESKAERSHYDVWGVTYPVLELLPARHNMATPPVSLLTPPPGLEDVGCKQFESDKHTMVVDDELCDLLLNTPPQSPPMEWVPLPLSVTAELDEMELQQALDAAVLAAKGAVAKSAPVSSSLLPDFVPYSFTTFAGPDFQLAEVLIANIFLPGRI